MQAIRDPAFWLLLAVATSASLDLSLWWLVPSSTTALALLALPKYLELWPKARAVGAEWAWASTLALSAFNSLGACAAAGMLGKFAAWFWR